MYIIEVKEEIMKGLCLAIIVIGAVFLLNHIQDKSLLMWVDFTAILIGGYLIDN